MMKPLFFFLACLAVVLSARGETSRADTTEAVRVDTLREIVVEAQKGLPVMEQFRKGLGTQPRTMGLGQILDKLSPGLTDKITHPFAIKQRKLERKRKKAAKILEDYKKVKSDKELFEDIVRRQREEDERNGMTNWQNVKEK